MKGRLRTLSSIVKPGKFESKKKRNRSVRAGELSPVLYITYKARRAYISRRGPSGCLSLDEAIPGPDCGISEYELPTSFLYPNKLNVKRRIRVVVGRKTERNEILVFIYYLCVGNSFILYYTAIDIV